MKNFNLRCNSRLPIFTTHAPDKIFLKIFETDKVAVFDLIQGTQVNNDNDKLMQRWVPCALGFLHANNVVLLKVLYLPASLISQTSFFNG